MWVIMIRMIAVRGGHVHLGGLPLGRLIAPKVLVRMFLGMFVCVLCAERSVCVCVCLWSFLVLMSLGMFVCIYIVCVCVECSVCMCASAFAASRRLKGSCF